jgi:hypothetical protein
MNRETAVYLDSYRLAQYAVQVPCYVCGQGNTHDSELCRVCYAPMALAHQAKTQKTQPRMIATIGASGVGKTVYLGMLMDMLSRQPHGLQLMARGAFSINMQQTTVSALVRREFPAKTPNEPDRWNWVHCQVGVGKRKKPVELVMPDMAGESILDEVDHPYTYPGVRSFLSRCSGVIILIDPTRARGGNHEQDYFAMKLLSYLIELDSDPKRGWPRRPVALVFSKADQCEECFLDPAGFAQSHTSGLWRHCQERFNNCQFFAAGVAGACAYRELPGLGRVRVPLRVEPRGIIEPFEWLIRELA